MPLAHPGLRLSRTPLLPMPGQRMFSVNWSGALVLGTLLFATLNPSWAQDTVWLPQPNLIRSTQTRHKSRFNGIMPAPITDPAHLFVVEQEEEEDQTT